VKTVSIDAEHVLNSTRKDKYSHASYPLATSHGDHVMIMCIAAFFFNILITVHNSMTIVIIFNPTLRLRTSTHNHNLRVTYVKEQQERTLAPTRVESLITATSFRWSFSYTAETHVVTHLKNSISIGTSRICSSEDGKMWLVPRLSPCPVY